MHPKVKGAAAPQDSPPQGCSRGICPLSGAAGKGDIAVVVPAEWEDVCVPVTRPGLPVTCDTALKYICVSLGRDIVPAEVPREDPVLAGCSHCGVRKNPALTNKAFGLCAPCAHSLALLFPVLWKFLLF